MDLKQLKRILELFDGSKATELTIESEGLKLKMAKHNKNVVIKEQTQSMPVVQQMPVPAASSVETAPAEPASVKVENLQPTQATSEAAVGEFYILKSPIVGTFYRSPSPDAAPFVEVGTKVQAGTTLCIVEAMKLMNEIESDISGTIEKIVIENGQPVEFDEALFYIKPD